MEQETRIELKPGDEHTFRLPGLGSAGYRWTYAVEGDESAVEVSTTRSAPPQLPQPVGPPPSNYSLDEIVIIRGRSPGAARIIVTQARTGQEPRITCTLDVTVSS